MPATYPIVLDLEDRMAVIIGGGAVAVRKATGLLVAGARGVRVVAPEIADQMPPGVERVNESYRADHLDGASIVFAATDSPEVNAAVVRDARERNILVSRADEPDDGDFALPAIHRDGPITVAVSANSPALSAFIRDELASNMNPTLRMLADQTQELRPLITHSDLPPEQRAEILRFIASREAVEQLGTAGTTQFQIWLLQRFPQLKPIVEARNARSR